MFCGILSIPHNIVMNLNNVMIFTFKLKNHSRVWITTRSYELKKIALHSACMNWEMKHKPMLECCVYECVDKV